MRGRDAILRTSKKTGGDACPGSSVPLQPHISAMRHVSVVLGGSSFAAL
jgi:hypothetical protein